MYQLSASPRPLNHSERKTREITRPRGRICPQYSHATAYAASYVRVSADQVVEILQRDRSNNEALRIAVWHFENGQRWGFVYEGEVSIDWKGRDRNPRSYQGIPFHTEKHVIVTEDQLVIEITDTLEWSGLVHVYMVPVHHIDNEGHIVLTRKSLYNRHGHVVYENGKCTFYRTVKQQVLGRKLRLQVA